MNELQIFKNDRFGQIRIISKDCEPWFVANDVCSILELGNTSMAISRLSENMKGVNSIDTLGGKQGVTVISESGLYKLIFTSRKPEAEKFTDWVTSEILPTIRKTGGYIANDDLFVSTYLPFADESTKVMFRGTLETVRKQNELIVKQQKELQHKEDVIIGLVDDIELAEKRQVLNRVVRYKNANFQQRWQELYKQFEMKYHIDLEKRLVAYNSDHKPKLKSKIDYIDKVMNKVLELYEIACKLYENDIKELTEQIYKLNEPSEKGV